MKTENQLTTITPHLIPAADPWYHFSMEKC